MSDSMMWNCFSIPGSLMSLMPNRGGIMGRLPRLQVFQEGVYSCGSLSVHKCPKVQVTWYPFPSMYPSLRFLAPSTSAMSRATLGFSAMQTIIICLLEWTKIRKGTCRGKRKTEFFRPDSSEAYPVLPKGGGMSRFIFHFCIGTFKFYNIRQNKVTRIVGIVTSAYLGKVFV